MDAADWKDLRRILRNNSTKDVLIEAIRLAQADYQIASDDAKRLIELIERGT